MAVLNIEMQKQLNDIQQSLIDFANTRCSATSAVTSTAFHSNGRKKDACFKSKAEGHWATDSKADKCRKKRHTVKVCRSEHMQGGGPGIGAWNGEKQGS